MIGYAAFSGAPTDYRGASAQLAAFARGSIEGFYSRDDRASSTNGAVLSFSNTQNTLPSGGDYGGQFGGNSCIKDYYLVGQKDGIATVGSRTSDVVGLAALRNTTTDQLLVNGDLTLTSSSGYVGQLSVFVNGNVYISGNITSSTASYANADAIPFLGIIARGNIFISGSVSQVDAFIVAQPSYTGNAFTANTGVVYTCASGIGSPVVENATSPSELNTFCRNQLTVNGYVIANRIKLLRVGGHRDAAPFNSSPSERFNATPELFLLDELPLNSLDGTYDAAASLPPIL